MCLIPKCTRASNETGLCLHHLFMLNRYNLTHPEKRISYEEYICCGALPKIVSKKPPKELKPKRVERPPAPVPKCIVNECIRPAKYGGMCYSHFSLWNKYNSLNPETPIPREEYIKSATLPEPKRIPKPFRKCIIDGCEEKQGSLGFCLRHYSSFYRYSRRHSDPDAKDLYIELKRTKG